MHITHNYTPSSQLFKIISNAIKQRISVKGKRVFRVFHKFARILACHTHRTTIAWQDTWFATRQAMICNHCHLPWLNHYQYLHDMVRTHRSSLLPDNLPAYELPNMQVQSNYKSHNLALRTCIFVCTIQSKPLSKLSKLCCIHALFHAAHSCAIDLKPSIEIYQTDPAKTGKVPRYLRSNKPCSNSIHLLTSPIRPSHNR